MANLFRSVQSVTISNGASLSSAQALDESRTLVGLITPAAWTAAAITFKVSMDGVTYYPLMDDTGTEVIIPSASIPTGAAWACALDPADFVAWKYVKVQSGTNAANTNQGADRAVQLVFREVN